MRKTLKKQEVFEIHTLEFNIFPSFGLTTKILKTHDEFLIIYKNLEVTGFDNQMDCFLVNSECLDYSIISLKDIYLNIRNFHLAYIYKFSNDKKYVNYLHIK